MVQPLAVEGSLSRPWPRRVVGGGCRCVPCAAVLCAHQPVCCWRHCHAHPWPQWRCATVLANRACFVRPPCNLACCWKLMLPCTAAPSNWVSECVLLCVGSLLWSVSPCGCSTLPYHSKLSCKIATMLNENHPLCCGRFNKDLMQARLQHCVQVQHCVLLGTSDVLQDSHVTVSLPCPAATLP